MRKKPTKPTKLLEVVDLEKDGWPCACLKRKNGLLTHIKLNHPGVAKCRVCGCTRRESETAVPR